MAALFAFCKIECVCMWKRYHWYASAIYHLLCMSGTSVMNGYECGMYLCLRVCSTLIRTPRYAFRVIVFIDDVSSAWDFTFAHPVSTASSGLHRLHHVRIPYRILRGSCATSGIAWLLARFTFILANSYRVLIACSPWSVGSSSQRTRRSSAFPII